MTVRRMREDDIPAIAALERDIFSDPWKEESIRDTLSSAAPFCYTAQEEGQVVGYLLGSFIPPEGEIFRIATDRQMRRRGVARTLLSHAISASEGLDTLFLEVRASNAGARAFYLSFGFSETGIRKNYYSDPREDAVLMTWRAPTETGF